MPSEILNVSAELSPDETIATVRIGNSTPIVCGCLGVERDSRGEKETIYLDRFIHRSVQHRVFSGWQPGGAVTSILTRINSG